MNYLEDLYQQKGFRFFVMTGRRRIGKTRLVKEFSKNKDHIRIQFEKRGANNNLQKINQVIGTTYSIPKPSFDSFKEAFQYLKKRKTGLVILDEFSYLIRYSDIAGEFQTIIDEILTDCDMMLIVLGSSFSVMKLGIMDYGAPLYGRSIGMLNLQPLKFQEMKDWFPDMSVEDLMILKCTVGGVPRYLEFIKGSGPVLDQIVDAVFDKNGFLFRDIKLMMEEEFDDPSTYYSILEAISNGKNRVTSIGDISNIEPNKISKYLSILVDIGILKKELPHGHNRKNGIYLFKDPFFRFWFKFISDVFEDIESGYEEGAVERFRDQINTFLGRAFESEIKELIPYLLHYKVLKVNKWWKGPIEIDWIAEGNEDITFIEVKWKDLGINDISRIFTSIEKRASKYGKVVKKVNYLIICRKIETKDLKLSDIRDVIDLEDIDSRKS